MQSTSRQNSATAQTSSTAVARSEDDDIGTPVSSVDFSWMQAATSNGQQPPYMYERQSLVYDPDEALSDAVWRGNRLETLRREIDTLTQLQQTSTSRLPQRSVDDLAEALRLLNRVAISITPMATNFKLPWLLVTTKRLNAVNDGADVVLKMLPLPNVDATGCMLMYLPNASRVRLDGLPDRAQGIHLPEKDKVALGDALVSKYDFEERNVLQNAWTKNRDAFHLVKLTFPATVTGSYNVVVQGFGSGGPQVANTIKITALSRGRSRTPTIDQRSRSYCEELGTHNDIPTTWTVVRMK